MSVSIKNRRVYREFEIIDEYEAGIKLKGSEVKAIKEGKGNLTGAHVKVGLKETWLIGFSIPPYSKSSNAENYDPIRTRKLLLNKSEISSLYGKTAQQGYTLIPLKVYTKGDIIKVSIGLARGRKKADKKAELIKKQLDRDLERATKELDK